MEDDDLADSQTSAEEFHLKEFELLKKEIEYRTASQERIERNVVVAVVAIYAWLAVVDVSKLPLPIKDVYPYLWWLPCIISGLGAARFWDDHVVISNIGAYIARREKVIDPKNGGWEGSKERRPNRTAQRITWTLRKSAWGLFIVGTASIAIYIRAKM